MCYSTQKNYSFEEFDGNLVRLYVSSNVIVEKTASKVLSNRKLLRLQDLDYDFKMSTHPCIAKDPTEA